MRTVLKRLEGWDIALLKRIKSSIFIKIFLSITAILMLTSLLIYGIAMVATPQSYKAQINERFSERVDQLMEQLQTVSRKDAEKIIVDFCIENQATVSLQSGEETLMFGNSDVLRQGGAGGVGATQTMASMIRFTDSDVSYTVMTAQELKAVNEMSNAFLKLFPWILLTIFIISVLGSFLCSRILAKPVQEISRISKRMSELDMTWHCDINRTDELGVLAGSLNRMAQKLSATIGELENANQQLQMDIEKERKQEKQRRAFFAAVSHELKTPITILKGQVESMIYGIGDYKNKEKHLPVTLETVERMENLLKEILTVSRLTADGFQLSKRSIDLSLLVRECLDTYEPLASKKKIAIHSAALEPAALSLDRKLFEKVISNVLSNAILYSPEGETVTVTLTEKILTVENSGVQIPEKKMPDLFAPLTRVEESRNKQSGGSGLGLYIVKTILDLHGLPYQIQNTERGVCFTIWFQRNQN